MSKRTPVTAAAAGSQLELDVAQMIEDHLLCIDEVPSRKVDMIKDAIMHDLGPLLTGADIMDHGLNYCHPQSVHWSRSYRAAKAHLSELNS